jgi:hypothetical protein
MQELDTKVWWRYGYVWFLIAGPLMVIVAGVITAYIAVSSPDPVIDQDYYQHGLDINKTLKAQKDSMAPAIQGRNHAATGASTSLDKAP